MILGHSEQRSRTGRAWLGAMVLGFGLWGSPTSAPAVEGVQIGYVENFDHPADTYKILRQGTELPVSIMAPILQSDTFRILDPKAKIVLRLDGRARSVVIRQADAAQRLDVPTQSKSYWSAVLSWTSAKLDLFDKQDRELVMADVRGRSGAPFSAPLLGVPQTIAAGTRPFAFGWEGPSVVTIRLLPGKGGKDVLAGKGVGGLWISDPVALKPGLYTIDVQSQKGASRQSLRVVGPEGLPTLPAALTDAAIPDDLRATAQAAWIVAQNERFALEGLQRVAGLSSAFHPAELLTNALIAGHRPDSPPPN